VFVLVGQYGPYVQLGQASDDNPKPKRKSLPRGLRVDEVTPALALGLLSLPRRLGSHPVTGAPIVADLGRFGPYVLHDQGKEGRDYRSLRGEDNVLSVTLERALELLAQPKAGRGRRAAPTPLRDFGAHPDDGQPVHLFDGRYGPYVKHDDVSASVPAGRDPAGLTLEQAVELLADKRASGGGRRRRVAKKVVKKAAKTKAKRTGARKKKAAAKK